MAGVTRRLRMLTVSIEHGRRNAIQCVFLTTAGVCVIVVLVRGEAPLATVWPGRRWLAALDALLWPAVSLTLLWRVEARPGIVGAVGVAMLGRWALRRLHRALARNERYRFTSWVWGRWLVLVLGLGLALRWAVLA